LKSNRNKNGKNSSSKNERFKKKIITVVINYYSVGSLTPQVIIKVERVSENSKGGGGGEVEDTI